MLIVSADRDSSMLWDNFRCSGVVGDDTRIGYDPCRAWNSWDSVPLRCASSCQRNPYVYSQRNNWDEQGNVLGLGHNNNSFLTLADMTLLIQDRDSAGFLRVGSQQNSGGDCSKTYW
jgi:hypothetical protein